MRVLDLFAGCGGMSLGFVREGFRIVGAVESDPLAAASHARNFFPHAAPGDAHAAPRDITATPPDRLAEELGLGPTPLGVDIVIGGPPCQSYARVGRAKLREVAAHPRAYQLDPRRNLYLHYLEYVRAFQPLAVVMENVPDLLNNGGHNVAEEVCESLEGMGYVCGYTLLNAAFYGVPQMRERAFVIGVAAEVGGGVAFPAPTHWVELPPSNDEAMESMAA